jgi:surface polysaccharide O-acyltransferase-like enzyme
MIRWIPLFLLIAGFVDFQSLNAVVSHEFLLLQMAVSLPCSSWLFFYYVKQNLFVPFQFTALLCNKRVTSIDNTQLSLYTWVIKEK